MKRRLVGFLLAAGLTLSGCASDKLNGLATERAPRVPDECSQDSDCPFGYICDNGICMPDPVFGSDEDPTINDDTTPGDDLDPDEDPHFPVYVGGTWQTEYHLDWSEYLGPLGGLGEPLDMVDQVLMGNDDLNDIPLVGPLIQAVIDNYIPDWIGDLVHILNGIVQFFEDVHIDAQMELEHVGGDLYSITGTEDWQYATVMIIDGCPLGLQDPSYPACAEVSVPLNSYVTNFGVIGAEALPFDGYIQTDHLYLPERRVRFQIAQLVTYILNYITDLASQGQYTTLEAALQSLIDCAGLSQSVSDSLCASLGICGTEAAIEAICVQSRDEVINQLMSILDAIMVEWEIMRFDQDAAIYDDDNDSNADRLGAPPSSPGAIENGGFEVIIGAGLYGAWWGERP